MNNNYTEVLVKVANHYGIHCQINKLVEEIHELEEAIKSRNINDIMSEMADVENMLLQVKYLLNLQEQISEIKMYKMERELGRINSKKDGVLQFSDYLKCDKNEMSK